MPISWNQPSLKPLFQLVVDTQPSPRVSVRVCVCVAFEYQFWSIWYG